MQPIQTKTNCMVKSVSLAIKKYFILWNCWIEILLNKNWNAAKFGQNVFFCELNQDINMLIVYKQKVNILHLLTVVDFVGQYEKETSQVKKHSHTWKRVYFSARYWQINGEKWKSPFACTEINSLHKFQLHIYIIWQSLCS